MKKILKKTTAIAMAIGMTVTMMPVMADINLKTDAKSQASSSYRQGQAVVVYQNTNARMSASNNISQEGIKIVGSCVFEQEKPKTRSVGTISSDVKMALVESDTYSTEEIIEKLKNNVGVLSVQPNYIYKASSYNDTYYDYQWALNNKGQNGGTEGSDIKADNDLLTDKDNKERVVAIIDTGVDYTHEDLQDVMWKNPYDSRQLGGKYGYNWAENNGDPMDDNGHGTHVAGIIKATANNGIGVSGAVNSSNIKIMALKFLDDTGMGDTFAAVEAYNYIYKAQLLGTNVVAVNDSWGGEEDVEEGDDALKSVIDMVGEKGALTVAAAGNEGANNDENRTSPAGLDSDYIISVAASNEKDQLASYSNYGSESVDIAAPGSEILSTVNYDCYNPGIYSAPMKLSSTYIDFNSGKLTDVSDGTFSFEDGNILYGTNDEDNISASLTHDWYIGQKSDNDKSIQFDIDAGSGEIQHMVYLPYEVGPSTTPISVSAMIKVDSSLSKEQMTEGIVLGIYDCRLTDDGRLDTNSATLLTTTTSTGDNCFDHFQEQVASKIKKKEKRALLIAVMTTNVGKYTINIDNFGVSKENVSSDKFGRYDFYSGTSMATPYVTAAVAAVANTYNTSKVLDVKKRVLGSVREVPELAEKVVSGGVLDLSKVETPATFVRSISLNSKKQIEIKGSYLKDVKVFFNDKEVRQISNNGNTITLDGSKYTNQQVTVKVVNSEKTYTKQCYFASGKAFTNDKDTSLALNEGQLISTGSELLYINNNGEVAKSTFATGGQDFLGGFDVLKNSDGDDDDLDDENTTDWIEYKPSFTPTMFGKEYKYSGLAKISAESDYVYTNKTLYGYLNLDVGYTTKTIVSYFDENAGWFKYADVPSDKANLKGVIFASYNGQLYLIGGMDENGNFSKKTYRYDVKSKKWIKAPDLPEGRAYGKAHQVGKKLVVTLGASTTDSIPKNIIFDGKKWIVSKTSLGKSMDTTKTVVNNKDIYITTGQTGIISNGIVYTNLRVNEKGDTFTYDVSKDVFKASLYSLDGANLGVDNILATTVDNRLYVVYGNNFYLDDYYGKLGMYAGETPTTSMSLYGDDDDYKLADTKTKYINVTSGFINITDKSANGAYVEGTGYYLPGDTVVLKAKAQNKNAVISGFFVNGKNVKKSSKGYVYTTLSTNLPMNCSVKAVLKTPSVAKGMIKKALRSKNNKKISLTFKKAKNISGYQIKYSTSKNFKKKTTMFAKSKKIKYVLKGLKAKKKYFIKVRTYKKKGKKITYGKWSKTKTVAVRKSSNNKKKSTKKNN